MSIFDPLVQPIEFGSAAQTDAFGRIRVSNPITLFDSKQLHDDQPLFWDEATTGSVPATSHSTTTASTTMSVSATTAGSMTRQTFQRFNYQPGKSLLVFMTGVLDLSGGGTDITREMGYYDANDGVFLQDAEGTYKFVLRNATSDTAVAQSSWNIDKMDGTGPSGITLDFSKAQIVVFDFEWLGVGKVRCGFVSDAGAIVYAHEFKHANSVTAVYMSTPNLPLRYRIDNGGTGVASTMSHICSTVISEGGVQNNGVLRYHSTAGTHLDLAADGTLYPVLGIRLKSTALDGIVTVENVSVGCETADDFEWVLLMDNPALTFNGGTPGFSDQTNSAVQTHTGTGAISITGGGTYITGGMVASATKGGETAAIIQNALRIGSSIAGTPDELYLCVRPRGADADIEASITWRELS